MNIFRKLYPFFLAVIGFNIIRLVTDIPNNDAFWIHDVWGNLKALGISILLYYWFDFKIRLSINRKWFVRKKRFDIVKEYVILILNLLIVCNLVIFLGGKTGLLYIGSPVRDYIIANVVTVLILTFYYTFIQREKIETGYREQAALLGKMKVENLENELMMLKSQFHPHFLFNALNTVYFQIDNQNISAKNTVELLSELLRYQLYKIDEMVNISEEICFIKSYIRFQQLRMTKCLVLNFLFDDALNNQKIYPLIYQPFLENAFKYVGGDYRINLEMKLFDEQIIFRLENSLPERVQQTKNPNSGIGIENIKRRLILLYPDRHQLNIKQSEKSFLMELLITP
jgi:sensor histidine kinase YesM